MQYTGRNPMNFKFQNAKKGKESMSEKIRFGIIGGGMAGPLNAGALRDIPEAEIVAFCDVKEDVAKKIQRRVSYSQLVYGLQRDVKARRHRCGLRGDSPVSA